MSFAVDVNLLLYASDASSAEHAKAHEFIARCVGGTELFCLTWPTVMAFLRMSTHSAIFKRPLSIQQANGNISALLALPHVRVLSELEGFWQVYRDITADVPTRGNLVPDAHVAALLRQHGVKVIYTHDKDFRKFSHLDVRDPLV
jgi:uncharacterized protein